MSWKFPHHSGRSVYKRKCYGELPLQKENSSKKDKQQKPKGLDFPDNIENSFLQGDLQNGSLARVQVTSSKPYMVKTKYTPRKKVPNYHILEGKGIYAGSKCQESEFNFQVFGKQYAGRSNNRNLSNNKRKAEPEQEVPGENIQDTSCIDTYGFAQNTYNSNDIEMYRKENLKDNNILMENAPNDIYISKEMDLEFDLSFNETNIDHEIKQSNDNSRVDKNIVSNGRDAVGRSNHVKIDKQSSPKWMRANKPSRKIFEFCVDEKAQSTVDDNNQTEDIEIQDECKNINTASDSVIILNDKETCKKDKIITSENTDQLVPDLNQDESDEFVSPSPQEINTKQPCRTIGDRRNVNEMRPTCNKHSGRTETCNETFEMANDVQHTDSDSLDFIPKSPMLIHSANSQAKSTLGALNQIAKHDNRSRECKLGLVITKETGKMGDNDSQDILPCSQQDTKQKSRFFTIKTKIHNGDKESTQNMTTVTMNTPSDANTKMIRESTRSVDVLNDNQDVGLDKTLENDVIPSSQLSDHNREKRVNIPGLRKFLR